MTPSGLPRETVVLRDASLVDALHAAIGSRYAIHQPGALPEGEAEWLPAAPGASFPWDPPRPLPGVKRFFFPARETLFRWKGERFEETTPDPPPFALVGLRSCDLAALAYQDRFFAGDEAYTRRRSRALLVGVNCLRACPGGFCPEVDAGPFAGGGFDLNLTRLPDGRVVVQVASEPGNEMLEAAGLPAAAFDEDTGRGFAAARVDAVASFPSRPFVRRAISRINAMGTESGVNDVEWRSLGRACLACTGCTSLCPTCSCFTVADEVRGESGERAREWDSCLLEGFQREASGHHPAARPGDRVRRFWYHKLSGDFFPAFGRYGCVGCGRCDRTCPGSIGALRVLRALGTP
jgi:formate hydrogenlyase subunit 6/NADH:ubiquinone oxidoreductase subunit I